MRLVIQTAADRVELDDSGKASLIGLIDELNARSFPARFTIGVFFQLVLEADEEGRDVDTEMRISPPDSDATVHVGGRATLPRRKRPGVPAVWAPAFNLENSVFRFLEPDFTQMSSQFPL